MRRGGIRLNSSTCLSAGRIQEEELKAEKKVIWKEYVLDFYKPVVSLLLAVLFIFFVVRPFLKRRPSLPQERAVPVLAQNEAALRLPKRLGWLGSKNL